MSREGIIAGRCRCGQANYTLDRKPFYSGYCHCTDCRERTGSACTSFMLLDGSALQLAGDMQCYRDQGGSGAPLDIFRCTHCGSVLYMQVYALKNAVAIAAETLDDKAYFQPMAHVWVGSKAPWIEIGDTLPQLPGPPQLPLERLNL